MSGAEEGIRDARAGDQGPERRLSVISEVERVPKKESISSGVISRSPAPSWVVV